jgi:predicted Mrr-cat superfamily restriction endonuclease
MTTRAWMVRITDHEAFCFGNDAIAIGWALARGVDNRDLKWDAFKDVVQAAYPQIYKNQYALGQSAGSIWRFVRDIKPDDWIVAPTWDGFNIARVTGPLRYDETKVNEDNAWSYPAEWIRRDIPRGTASAPLQARCTSRQTCIEATEFSVEIEQLSRQVGKINLESALAGDEARIAIGKVLDHHLTPDGLELLVMQLASKGGAQVDRPPKNLADKKGDADVIARYTFPPFAIGYQVKKHGDKSKTDEYAVTQIIEAMEDERLAIDLGYVVTTATEFTEGAKILATGSTRPVRLMTRDDLVHWVLYAGISSLR